MTKQRVRESRRTFRAQDRRLAGMTLALALGLAGAPARSPAFAQ